MNHEHPDDLLAALADLLERPDLLQAGAGELDPPSAPPFPPVLLARTRAALDTAGDRQEVMFRYYDELWEAEERGRRWAEERSNP